MYLKVVRGTQGLLLKKDESYAFSNPPVQIVAWLIDISVLSM